MAYDLSLTKENYSTAAVAEAGSAQDFSFRTRRIGFYRARYKRMLDVAIVLIFALPAIVLIGILAALVATDGKSPFYTQMRVGRHGRNFKMWKLRSMKANADEMLESYLASNPEARREWDETQKLKNDPRITRVGRIIRKTSLDELPQLLNVLLGDMSLVGPRPMMCEQKSMYPGTAYFEMRPGITGPWQISERNESSFADRAPIDSRYLRELSLTTDLRILCRTVGVVVKATGY